MKFPPSLMSNDRPTLQESKILLSHFLYSRHRPGHDWNSTENIPDFTKIKIPESINESEKGLGQSFNWNIYSIPVWTRFDDQQNYLENYAVVGYSVKSIRRTGDVLVNNSQSGIVLENGVLEVKHSPNKYNHSHCHLALGKLLNKSERREVRMAIKHSSFVPLYPGQARNIIQLYWDLAKMYLPRGLAKVLWYIFLLNSVLTDIIVRKAK